jgi:type I restriction enzyme S subunit
MKVCRLAEVATIDSGAGFPLQYQGAQGETFPFLKVSDMNLAGNERAIRTWNNSISEQVRAKLRAKAFPAGTLIFPKIGAAIGTNKKRQLTQPSCVDNNVMGVVPKAELLESEFLYYQFLAKNISDFASDSNPPSIRKSDVENWIVRVPTLHEQRRIVDILSRAEGIVRLRRDAEKKAAELIPALFLDMFGDPATNPKGWPMAALGDVCTINPRLDKHQKPTADSIVTFVPMAAVDGIRGEVVIIEPRNYASVAKGFTPFIKDDVLFAKITPCMENGKAAIVPELVGGYGFGSTEFHVLRSTEHLHKAWLFGFVRREVFRQQAKLNFSGTAGQQRVPVDFLKTLSVPVPDFKLQIAFAQALEQIRSIQSQQSAATAKAQATFDALLAQVFG